MDSDEVEQDAIEYGVSLIREYGICPRCGALLHAKQNRLGNRVTRSTWCEWCKWPGEMPEDRARELQASAERGIVYRP